MNINNTTPQLDKLFMTNKFSHRCPIINVPEIIIYKYTLEDLIECGKNFRECAMPKDDDPINNTVRYYTDKCERKYSQAVLNRLLEKIIDNKYAIFSMDEKWVYLISLDTENEPTICMDSLCKNPTKIEEAAIFEKEWDKSSLILSYDEFISKLKALINSPIYRLNKDMRAIVNSNSEYKDQLSATEAVDYDIAMEADDVVDIAANTTAALNNDGTDTVENMNGEEPQQAPQNQDGNDENQEPIGGEDDSEEANVESNDEENPEDMESEDEEPAEEEETETTDEKFANEILNDPAAKIKFRAKFVYLYKHIQDVSNTLQQFTPEFNSKFVPQYYDIQLNLTKLSESIYKLCTEKIPQMEVLDIMKAYTAANMAYDTLGKMMDNFATSYDKERDMKNKKQKSRSMSERPGKRAMQNGDDVFSREEQFALQDRS